VTIRCEWCQREWTPYHSDDRFCCREHSDAFYQAERREAVEWYRAMGLRPALRNGEQQQEEAMIERTGT
jgi:hypothetical protein